jgi:membrane dipeptidase
MDVVWDAHSCLPLDSDISFSNLLGHKEAGFDFVSVNVGMDMTPTETILKTLAWFRASILSRPDRYALVGTISQLENAMAERRLAIAFDLEGANCLLGRPEMVQLYAELGVRQMHLAYNRNNSVAGGCLDAPMRLTRLGHDIVKAMNDAGVIVDCSHTGRMCSMDIMAVSERPVVFSHANAARLCDVPRNVTDEQIIACAATGGVVGICGYGRFIGELPPTPAGMARHIDYVAQLVGVDFVGIGWDHSYPHEGVPVAPDAATLAHYLPFALQDEEESLTLEEVTLAPSARGELDAELRRLGYDSAAVAKVMGGNFCRVATDTWPA